MKLDKVRTLKIIKAALKEDIGPGDITTTSVVPKFESVKASIVTNEDCILCGIDVAEWILNEIDYSVRFKPQAEDGHHVYQGKQIAFIEGHARSMLTAERTMLNFICFLSGIATKVNRLAEKVKKYNVDIYDTRKTIPLLRYLEKYAVLTGGGKNHRHGLWDQVLIKENHLKLISREPRDNIVSAVRRKVTKNIKIEIEVEDLEEFEKALTNAPDIILLDNMKPDDIKKAVNMRNKKDKSAPLLEISGGISEDNIEEYAKTGADRISIGDLTDSVRSIDMSLDIVF